MSVKISHQFAGKPCRSSFRISIIACLCVALLLTVLFPASRFAQRKRPLLQPATKSYFAGKIILIPRDSQFLQLRLLAQVADQDLVLPPSRFLDPKPQPDKLIEWAKDMNLAQTNGVIISLETIAATAPDTPATQALKQLRAQQPKLPLYGFASLDASATSRQICQTGLDLAADGTLNFLLIEQAEPLSEKPAQIARARLIGEIASRQIEDRVAFDDAPEGAAASLIARLVARRYNQSPRILAVYSSKEGQTSTESRDTIALNQSIGAKIKLTGGALPVQDSETAPAIDLLLFIHAPQTNEEQRAAFTKVLTQTVERGMRVAVVDLSRTKAAKESFLSELRNQKLLDKLIAYASSELVSNPTSDATREAASRALAQAVMLFTSLKSLRNDLDRVFRIDRAQVGLMFSRYLQDWAYNLTVRPKLDAYLLERKGDSNNLPGNQSGNMPGSRDDAVERAEKFAFEQLQPIAKQLFDEQFRRNTHAILLNSGERAEFRISLLQRLQIRFTTLKSSQVEIKQSIHTFYEGIIPMIK
ncbi:MAG: DUF4127 family protein [Acidobacteriota bacterium]|nr:DUF4127 family protein [Acidobacteriota bacterium]